MRAIVEITIQCFKALMTNQLLFMAGDKVHLCISDIISHTLISISIYDS